MAIIILLEYQKSAKKSQIFKRKIYIKLLVVFNVEKSLTRRNKIDSYKRTNKYQHHASKTDFVWRSTRVNIEARLLRFSSLEYRTLHRNSFCNLSLLDSTLIGDARENSLSA